MPDHHTPIYVKEDSDLIRALNLFTRNYKKILISVSVFLVIAFIYNRITLPVYNVSSQLLIEEKNPVGMMGNSETEGYINQNLFGVNQGFQNELYVLQSTPIVDQVVRNLDLTINYYKNNRLADSDLYGISPFRILVLNDHVQPVNVRFMVSMHDEDMFTIKAETQDAYFCNLLTGNNGYSRNDWSFEQNGKFGYLIETPDMAFVVERDSSISSFIKDDFIYSFVFRDLGTASAQLKRQISFNVVDRDVTIIEISTRTTSTNKGIDVINELMDVYSTQNINRKNHVANATIDYIERQLGEISDSLSQTEDNLQNFLSSRQLISIDNRATSLSQQYVDLQNQLAELISKRRYYGYFSDYITTSKDFSDITIPNTMGVDDDNLNNLVSDLISAQNQRANLIRNNQEKNPMVQRLEIQIESIINSISENITSLEKSTDISIDELNKRINQVRAEISRLPQTQRQLGGIERKYRLNDAIYNYLLEKRAEAKISQASNQPDNIIVEPANVKGIVSPNIRKNYLIAFSLGIVLPYLFFFIQGFLRDKIEYEERIDRLTDAPLLGKIRHNRRKNNNVVFEHPTSGIAEAYRALRTNIEYKFKDIPHKVILVTSSIEGEGKSFTALNLAMIYAQLGRRTLLVDFDLRKPTGYFSEQAILPIGLSSYFSDRVALDSIIHQTMHNRLDYIPSGPIPPNPVEMLASEEIMDFMIQVKEQYDYIILDTTPLAQVSDAYLLMDYADVKIVIARYNHTLKRVFHLIMDDLKQKGISNVCVVLNDNRSNKDQYGYGYGYEHKKRKFLNFKS